MVDLSSIFSIGSLGLNLFANVSSRNASKASENSYLQQAEINRQIGALNAEAANRAGTESMYSIIAQTKKMLGSQIVAFSNRGIDLEGSPMMVLGETATMGQAHAQQALFNARVNAINYELGAQSAIGNAMHYAETSKYNAATSMMNTVTGVADGYKMMKSMFSSSTLNNNVAPTAATSSNSTIQSLLLSRLRV